MKTLNEKETWQAALGEFEVIFSDANYGTWFKDTFIKEISPNEIIIGVPYLFAKEWLENKFHPQIFETLKKFHPTIKNVKYVISSPQGKQAPLVEDLSAPKKPEPPSFSSPTEKLDNFPALQKKYTFENFVVGNSNRLAVATATAVAKSPGKTYNPLFIYGGVGLGKTHLVQAVGNEIKKSDPKKKIVYVSCEKFTNDFISSISNKKTSEFKKNYRNADVLMVDDIQFMSGKEGTQEEFFHTFNALHQADRQIIITSDSVPQAIPQLTERLSSRFGWGMVADIQTPNLEMRQAIVRNKCEEKKVRLEDDVLDYIAQNIESNIRELEGAINLIVSTSEIQKIPPSLDLATNCLANIVAAKSKNISVEKIFQIISEMFKITNNELLSAKRNQELVRPRQIIMYILRHEMNLSYPKISQHLNKKDHTTIIYGVEKIEKEIARDEELHKQLVLIKEKIHAF